MEELVASGRAPTFNELLIHEVRTHPELYDQQHRVCTDNGERNFTWEVIAARIDRSISGEFAKKRWLQMRDRYRKELKMALRNMVAPKWPYFRKLAWLDPYLKDTKNATISSSAALFNSDVSSTAENSDVKMSFEPSGDYLPVAGGASDESTRSSLLESIVAATAAVVRLPPAENARRCSPQPAEERSSQSPPDSSAVASTSGESSGTMIDAAASSAAMPHRFSVESGDRNDPADCRRRADSTVSASSSSGVDCSDGSATSKPTRSAFPTPPPQSSSSATSPALVELNLAVLRAAAAAASGIRFPATASNSPGAPSRRPTTDGMTRQRHRNPPYLVRRGGTVKVRNSAFTVVRPSASPPPCAPDGADRIDAFTSSNRVEDLSTHQFSAAPDKRQLLWDLILSRSGGSTVNSRLSSTWLSQLQQLAATVSFRQPGENFAPAPAPPLAPSDFNGALNLSRTSAIKTEPDEPLSSGWGDTMAEKMWQGATWLDDEDLLFARLVVVRLRRLSASDRRLLRSQITDWIDRLEARTETNSSRQLGE